jgi:hypothetical protein
VVRARHGAARRRRGHHADARAAAVAVDPPRRRRAHHGVPVPVRRRHTALVEPDGARTRDGRARARLPPDRQRSVSRRRPGVREVRRRHGCRPASAC